MSFTLSYMRRNNFKEKEKLLESYLRNEENAIALRASKSILSNLIYFIQEHSIFFGYCLNHLSCE